MNYKFESLDVGMKLEIVRNDDKEDVKYPSQVLDIIEPDELIISGPIKKGELVLLHKDEELKVFYNVENKGKYYFTAKVISREYSKIYTLRLKLISSTRKIQLRNYFRLPINIPVEKKFKYINNNDEEIINEKCDAKDISGGGMKLYCNYKHEVDDEIQLEFKIDDTVVQGKASVIRIEEIENPKYKYAIGVFFTEVTEYNRDIIIKYIFERQRILRLKGMI